ncbi:MAG: hypothetical protein M5U33_01900 [Pseudorhodoplanes sp.]|nr:hypothetical protein [Pseudorhodoplanes sp.]
MRRLQDYLTFIVWQAGFAYIALWVVTFWTLDYGPAIFGQSSGCHPDKAAVLFYWSCDPQSPLWIFSTVANTALTITVWAPVYVAAATVRPEAPQPRRPHSGHPSDRAAGGDLRDHPRHAAILPAAAAHRAAHAAHRRRRTARQ